MFGYYKMARPRKLQDTQRITPLQRRVLTTYYNLNPRTRIDLRPYRTRYNQNIRQIQAEYDRRQEGARTIQRAIRRLRARRTETEALEGGVQQRVATPQEVIPFTPENAQAIARFCLGNIFNPILNQQLIFTAQILVRNSRGEYYYTRRILFQGLYTRATRTEVFNEIYKNIVDLSSQSFAETGEDTKLLINVKVVSTIRNDLQGGCAGRNCKGGRNIKIGGTWITYSPKGDEKSNDCLFKCLSVENPIQTRKKLGIPRGEKIGIEKLPAIADFLKKRIIVYSPNQKKLIDCGCEYTDITELVLIHEHYTLITKKQQKCPDCRRCFYEKHTCDPADVAFINARRKGKRLVQPQKTKIKTEAPDFKNIIYFDFETFTPPDKPQFEVYASGYYNLATGEADRFYGKNALKDFVDYIIKQENKIFIAHNGSRFDNYFLFQEMIDRGVPPQKIIMNNGAIMSFQFGKGNKAIDSINFLMCPLGSAGEAFKIPKEYWKSEFNHSKIKTWEDTEKYKDEVIAYLDLDILCLKKVWEAFSQKIYEAFNIWTTDFITTSSMAWCIWVNNNDQEIFLPNEKELEFIRRSTYGANVYPVKKHFKSEQYDKVISGELKYKDITDYLKIMDVVSLYPTSMLNEFPIGNPRWTTDKSDTDKMGIWEINFKPRKDLIVSQLPRKVDGGIIHSLEDGTGVYNSVDIARAKDAGYEIEYIRGMVWDKTWKIFSNYVNNGFDLKNKAREEEDDVMYAISKLLLNGLYGKTLQRPIYLETKIISNHADAVKFVSNHDELKDVCVISKTAVLYSGEVAEKNREKAITKPTHLGSFVLGYSRSIMYNIQKEIDPTLTKPVFYYTDTDCLHIHADDLPKVDKFMGDNLGQINSDLKKEGIILEGIYLAPKQYSVCYIDNTENIYNKCKCKGISKRYLNPDMYKNALVGTSTEVKMKDSFKKIHYRQNNNQQQFTKFSVHLEDIDRTFHKNSWNGRVWLDDNSSLPIGHINL